MLIKEQRYTTRPLGEYPRCRLLCFREIRDFIVFLVLLRLGGGVRGLGDPKLWGGQHHLFGCASCFRKLRYTRVTLEGSYSLWNKLQNGRKACLNAFASVMSGDVRWELLYLQYFCVFFVCGKRIHCGHLKKFLCVFLYRFSLALLEFVSSR